MAKSSTEPCKQPPLRFKPGDRVFCRMKDKWEPSTIFRLWWCEPEDEFFAEKIYYHPYQAIPDSRTSANGMKQWCSRRKKTPPYSSYPDGAIYVPFDSNECVRRIPIDEEDEILLAIECNEDIEFIMDLIDDRKIEVRDPDDYTFCEKMAFTSVEHSHIRVIEWLHCIQQPLELFRNERMANLLHFAIQLNKSKVVECLLRLFGICSALYEAVDERGFSILHYMALYGKDEMFSQFDYFVSRELKHLHEKEDYRGRTALFIAKSLGRAEVLSILSEN